MPSRRAFLLSASAILAALLAGSSCAHSRSAGKLDTLQPAVERFHLLLRWGDLRGVARFVVPERRAAFLKAIVEAKDEENLKVMEYELEDAQIAGDRAVVLSRLTWHRMPSMSVRSEMVLLNWVYRDKTWLLESTDGGPLPLAAQKKTPASSPSTAPNGSEAAP